MSNDRPLNTDPTPNSIWRGTVKELLDGETFPIKIQSDRYSFGRYYVILKKEGSTYHGHFDGGGDVSFEESEKGYSLFDTMWLTLKD